MDFCGARPANIAKTQGRPGASVAGRFRRGAPVRAFGAGDRTTHVYSLRVTFESLKLRASPGELVLHREILLLSLPAQSKQCRLARRSATGRLLGSPGWRQRVVAQTVIHPMGSGHGPGTDQPYRATA